MAPLEAINIENSILGSIILDNTLAYKLDELTKDMFSVSYNKEIFEIMKNLHKNNYTLDIPTIKTKLDERKVDVMISYISKLSSIGETYAIDTHINILKDKFKRKCIKLSCMNLITEILENKDIDSSLFKFEKDIKNTIDQDIDDKDDMSSICERILHFLENDKETGLKFGVKLLDEVIGGLFKGELTTIAARSGVGKTALALQIMLNCANQGKKVLFISREMSNEQYKQKNRNKCKKFKVQKLKRNRLEKYNRCNAWV